MDGWRSSTIGDECEVIAGQSPKSTHYNDDGDGLPFYQGKKEFGEKFIGAPTKWTTHVTRESVEGDVLMSVRAPVGPINFATERICIGRGLAAIRARNGLSREFLYYSLLANERKIRGSEGAVFASINRSQIETLPIRVPPLTVQERIVGLLDEAFAAIATATAHTECNRDNARELFENERDLTIARGGEDWLERPLGELVTIKHGFAFKSEFFTDAGDFVLLTPGNFFEGGGYRDRSDKQKYYVGDIPDGFVLDEGDMLLAMTEQAPGLLGSPLIVPESDRFLHNQRLGLIQPLTDVPWHTEFFFHAFNTTAFRRPVHATSSGLKVRHTSPKKMYRVVMRLPESVEEQQRVARRLDSIRSEAQRLTTMYDERIARLDELRQSLLHQAFTGQLTADERAADRALAEAGV